MPACGKHMTHSTADYVLKCSQFCTSIDLATPPRSFKKPIQCFHMFSPLSQMQSCATFAGRAEASLEVESRFQPRFWFKRRNSYSAYRNRKCKHAVSISYPQKSLATGAGRLCSACVHADTVWQRDPRSTSRCPGQQTSD